MNNSSSKDRLSVPAFHLEWDAYVPQAALPVSSSPHPSRRSLVIAVGLFFLTLVTCLASGAQFASAYSQGRAASFEEFFRGLTLLYKSPMALAAGVPFAFTLLTILLAHELGHFFACRLHGIRASFPFFIPFPSLIGTFGAFIVIRSPIRTARALFDVGASGPFAGFVLALPALVYGVIHAQPSQALADPQHADVIFGAPLLLHALAAIFHPGVAASQLLLHPVGRAAWIGLFATSLNLLPAGQLDGGHILRSVSPRVHRWLSLVLPLFLVMLGWSLHWTGWYVWAGLLLVIRFVRVAPFCDSTPLDPARKFGALLALVLLILCFMPAPLLAL